MSDWGSPVSQCLRVLLLLSVLWADGAHEEAKTFIGWKGEAYKPDVLWYPTRKQGGDHSREWVELLSWSPRAFVYHNLLTNEECDHLQEAAVAKLSIQPGVPGVKGTGGADLGSGDGAGLPRAEDEVVEKLHNKLAEWLGVPSSHHEDIKVLEHHSHAEDGIPAVRMAVEAKLNETHDRNPRIATVLLFLSSVENGGETVFPDASWADLGQKDRNGPWSSCADGHVAVKPRKGDALLFFSLWPNGYFDKHSFHHDCPMQEGSKWIGTVQVHANPLQIEAVESTLSRTSSDPHGCEDRNPMCSSWAEEGWCKSKEKFMVGDNAAGGTLGVCRLACKVCEACEPSDKECLKRKQKLSGNLGTSAMMNTRNMPGP